VPLNGEVRVVEDVPTAFCSVMAEAWEDRANRGFTVALSGGETARACYERLADWAESPIDWMSTEVYWGDERCVPLDHPDSNYALAKDALFSHVGGVHALFPMLCDEGDDAYNLLVSSLGALDVVHLGVGVDGHTASIFPGSPAMTADPGRLVVANRDASGENPHPRMTLTFAGIRRARRAVVTISGSDKRDVFAALEAGEDLPAARIDAERVIWLVDHAAAGRT
jgi:6-phosphogluconolactonase